MLLYFPINMQKKTKKPKKKQKKTQNYSKEKYSRRKHESSNQIKKYR